MDGWNTAAVEPAGKRHLDRRIPMLEQPRGTNWSKATMTAMVGLGALSLTAAFSRGAATQTSAAAKEPNIVVVALDDVGFADLGPYGSEISTPNIDSLASRGLRYTRFDTMAICSPTRASLLTGRNCQTVRMGDLASHSKAPNPADTSSRKGEIPTNAEFLPEALHRAGYATFAIGKWHLAPAYETGKPGSNSSFPLQRGFDYFYGYKMGWTDQYRPELFEGNNPIPDQARPGYYLSADLADHAIHVMEESQRRDPDKPMFLYLAMPFAHAPVQAPKEYIDRYVSTYAKGWDEIRAERFERQKKAGVIPSNTRMHARERGDPAWDSLTDQQRRVYARYMATYAAYLQYGDEQLGRVLKYLKDSGLEKNTLVVLFSDNGAAGERKLGGFRQPYSDKSSLAEIDAHLNELGGPLTQPLYPRPWAIAGDTPFRRYKLWPFLGGVRTPLIVAWPGHIPDQGGIRKQWVDVIDVAPTLLEAAGTHFDNEINGVSQIPVAGASFLKTLRSPNEPSRRTAQFFELRGNRAISDGKWRAVAFHRQGTSFASDEWKLFDINSDPAESTDLAKKYPAKLNELKSLWNSEAQKYGDMPLQETTSSLAHEFDDAFQD
jgi:arylsulfatase